MNVLHLVFSFSTGGIETMLVDILNLQANRAKVSLIIVNDDVDDYLLNKINSHIRVIKINRVPSSRELLPLLKLNYRVWKSSPDIIHCHHRDLLRLLSPNFRKYAVLTVHSTGLSSHYFGRYSMIYSISNSVKWDLKKRCQVVSQMIYNGVDVGKIGIRMESQCFGKFKMVIVSRLYHLVKGQHLAIDALRILKYRLGITNIQLDLIGEGDSKLYLEKMVLQFGLTENVNFLGIKSRDYIYGHIKDYNLLIQPSLSEGFGLTVAEGMAAKVPVLVSNIEGPMEIIRNGDLGHFFLSNNSNDLANKIVYIIRNYNSELVRGKIEEAYNYTKREFNISSTANKYLESYELLCRS